MKKPPSSNGVNHSELWIRARCTPTLKKRLADYMAYEEKRGNSKKESEVLREILVDFLDHHEPVGKKKR
jgi:hypothetical protein